MSKIGVIKRWTVILGTISFVFLFYFENSIEKVLRVKDIFYTDYMFYVAVLISLLVWLFIVKGFKEKKE